MSPSTEPKQMVALVTGASGGLGQSLATELDSLGCAVAVHYNRDEASAREVAEKLTNDSVVVQANLADWDAVEQMCKSIERDLGHINVLVNNAAIRNDALMAMQSPLDWREVIETNLIGTFHTCRATVPKMLRSRWGRIVNVVSPSGIIATPGQTAYGASKSGVIGLTRTLAAECGRRGVTVNALSPGFMPTGMTTGLSDKFTDGIKSKLPIPRFTTTDEVAQSIGFFVDNAYVTGQVISVDGGISIM